MSQIGEESPSVGEEMRRAKTTQKYKKLQELHCREDLRHGTASTSLVTPPDCCDEKTSLVLSGGQALPFYEEPADEKKHEVREFLVRWDNNDCPLTEFEDFVFLAYLGGGGYGCVYAIEQKSWGGVGKIGALKIQSKARRSLITNAQQERRMCWALRHELIVEAYAWCEDDENTYLRLSLAEHGDITRYRGLLPERVLKLVAAQIVLAIEYIHGCGVVHCDLKPENIFVSRSGKIKVGDFGCAQLMRTFTTLEGSYPYMAPEVWRRERLDRAVDWWFMGIFLYEYTFLEHPFFKPGATLEANKQAVLNNPPRKLEENTPYCRIVEDFLIKDPTARLGLSKRSGARAIKRRSWFRGVDFGNLESLSIPLTFDGEICSQGWSM